MKHHEELQCSRRETEQQGRQARLLAEKVEALSALLAVGEREAAHARDLLVEAERALEASRRSLEREAQEAEAWRAKHDKLSLVLQVGLHSFIPHHDNLSWGST